MQPDLPVLRVLESRRADDTLVVSVEGEIDLATVPTLAAHFDRIFDRAAAVTVDLRRVGFLDCVGLRELICLHEEGLATGCAVGFIQGPETVRRVFELTGTLSRLSFADAA
jgi:anti-sigma B factor antagonist